MGRDRQDQIDDHLFDCDDGDALAAELETKH